MLNSSPLGWTLIACVLGTICLSPTASSRRVFAAEPPAPSPVTAQPAEAAPAKFRFSPAKPDERGWQVHTLESPFQPGETLVRVLLPAKLDRARRYPVIYVLPVEPGEQARFGDGLKEILGGDWHNRSQTIFVAPTFAQYPWYADHPEDPAARQESHFVEMVVKRIDETYPTQAEATGRRLLGFSKSGWGAWSLLLRHPDTFGRAVAWDAPLDMERVGQYQSGEVFGTQARFEDYRLRDQAPRLGAKLGDEPRLILLGYGNFRPHHEAMHRLLDQHGVPHLYRDGPQRKHLWNSGWVPEAVELLSAETLQDTPE